MMRSPIVLCAAVLALWRPVSAVAQQPPARNPHGVLTQPCATCHSPEAWSPPHMAASFDHAKVASFPLAGAHSAVACKSCHASLKFTEASRDCVGCHTDPHHGELGTACAQCHTPRSFLDRSEMGRAHQVSRFPLTGAHVAVDCEVCHTSAGQGQMTFVARSSDCNSCHLKDYQAARNPDHTAGGFPHDCQACHATVTWVGARFDHHATRFPLTGAHVAVSCAQCHGTGGFGALPTACVSCHQADYDAATDPNHRQAQFATDCASCHTTTVWTSATFTNHDAQYFPIYAGAHRGRWTSCSTCHVNPNDYRQFDCLSCHTQAQTTSHHSGVNGYTYDSPSCYHCHPRGSH